MRSGSRWRATARRIGVVLCLLALPACGSSPERAAERSTPEGQAEARFPPGGDVGRGPALQALWQAAGSPRGYPGHGLGDVGAGIDAAVRWGVAEGVLAGFPDRTFRPRRPVTRSELIAWLWRADGSHRQEPAADGTLVAYPPARLAGVAAAPATWAVAEGVLRPRDRPAFRGGGAALGREVDRWLGRWADLPTVELAARMVDANLLELHWRARDTLAGAPLLGNIETGLVDEPTIDLVPGSCGAGTWCGAEVRVGRAGWTRATLTVAVGARELQASAEALVDRLPDPVVAGERMVLDLFGAEPQVLRWAPPPGVAPGAPLETDFVQLFAPGRVVPFATKFPLDGEFVAPAAERATGDPKTWNLRYCRRPQGGPEVIEDVVCSPGVQVTFDPEGAQFTGPLGGDVRQVVEPGDDLELSWSGPGDEFVLEAPTLLPDPLTLTGTSQEIADVPEGVHEIALVSCAPVCPDDVSSLPRERLQVVAGLDEQVPTWTTRPVTSDFSVETIDTLDRPSTGAPLDVTFDGDGDVWMIGEFGADVAQAEGAELTHHETPSAFVGGAAVGAFANPFHREEHGPECRRTPTSALAERVVVTDDHVWFTQGGALFPPTACVSRNHSRLVGFDRAGTDDPTTRGDDRFCAVPVPGVNGEVVGIAHDPATDRIWFTEPEGADGPALHWFAEDEVTCRNRVDYTDPAAVAAAEDPCPANDPRPGCVHRIPLGEGIRPAHLAVDAGTGHVWVSDYSGHVLARYPLSGVGTPEQFPLPASYAHGAFNGFPWQIRATDDAVYLVEYADNQLLRFDTTVPDPAEGCAVLVDGRNPCIQEVFLPVAADTLTAHSIDVEGDRLWFTVADEAGGVEDPADAYLGYLDLSTWTSGTRPAGITYDLTALGPPPGRGHRAPRGIDVEPGTGRVAVAEMGGELLVLSPR